MFKAVKILIVLIAVLFANFSFAGFQEGMDAAQKGDFTNALKEWHPLAERGNTSAKINLGLMYAKGRGVKKDDVQAVQWYRKAAEQGRADANSI